jgi:hypothetical protein
MIDFTKSISENELRNIIKDKEISQANWNCISANQNLSEKFIRDFQDKVNWYNVSIYQKLSEEFIKEFQDNVNWKYISKYQKLSEDFIKEFQDNINWDYISEFQKLSEKFIRNFKNNVNWNCVLIYQKLSEEFRKEFNLKIPKTCWLYKSPEDIEEYIKEYTNYEIINREVIAYKSCRSDGYSTFNFQYLYEVGKEYESHADYNIDNDASFGLSAWTKERAMQHCKEKLFKVAIKLEDIAAIVQDNNKIRARKIRIIKEII